MLNGLIIDPLNCLALEFWALDETHVSLERIMIEIEI